ncbi:hypothetical protein B0E43_07455 [Algoriphagus sp. A40]|nr:hypothetical protein B0E43_07455 [Algoriphagus sp. A40]
MDLRLIPKYKERINWFFDFLTIGKIEFESFLKPCSQIGVISQIISHFPFAFILHFYRLRNKFWI